MKTPTFMLMTGALSIAATAGFAQMTMTPDNVVSADQLTEGKIYRMEIVDDTAWNTGNGFNTVEAEWVDIGDIEDILLDKNGQMVGILAEIGGFLDIGDRDIIIPIENVRFSTSGEREYHFVTNMSEAELEALPEVDEDMWD